MTYLFGGLTWKHLRLIEGLVADAGSRSRALPETNRTAHEHGEECSASRRCNPVHFTPRNLIRFLRQLERGGLSRAEIVKQYVHFPSEAAKEGTSR